MNKCKVCGQEMQIKFVPKGKMFLWKHPDNMKSEWFDTKPFSLGTDYKLERDLRHLSCSCGYDKYEEIK